MLGLGLAAAAQELAEGRETVLTEPAGPPPRHAPPREVQVTYPREEHSAGRGLWPFSWGSAGGGSAPAPQQEAPRFTEITSSEERG